jgi:hypothetical protein
MRIFQAIHDSDKDEPTIIFNGKDKAAHLNGMGYGIFGSVNDFNSIRRESDLKKLNFWFCEMDGGTKEEQLERIKRFLLPTLIVESKRGYHCYWAIKEDLIKQYGLINALVVYKEINKRIISKLGADKNASDAARVLRVPGYYHCKDPSDKFLITIVLSIEISYTPQEMLLWLPELKEPAIRDITKEKVASSGSFWGRANSIGCMSGLTKLSGTAFVKNEVFDFIPDGKKFQISVNGKRANCWIDEHGFIGSSAGGGPTIVNWLKYYGHDMKTIAEIIKEIFPECGIEEDLPAFNW